MSADTVDALLVLLIGAGLSDKKARELLLTVQEMPAEQILRRYRGLKKAISNAPQPKPMVKKDPTQEVDRAIKLLQSVGPFSESEIINFIINTSDPDLFRASPVPKGGLKNLLQGLAQDVGAERMAKIVTVARNELAHSPRHGWTTRDVK